LEAGHLGGRMTWEAGQSVGKTFGRPENQDILEAVVEQIQV